MIELLLKRSIDNLGRVGDVVKVRPGYARNYLLPHGFAVPVTKANLADIEKARAAALAAEKERVEQLKISAGRLAETSVTIEGRANEEGHLFGSVTAAQIAEALTAKDFVVDARAVKLEHPLKEIGVFEVPVALHAEVEAIVKVWVVQQKPA
jgi:large subunit ribosomal protein L9